MDVTEHTHIVVVNDSPEFLELMADLLHDHHYAATVIDGDRENAVDLVRAASPTAWSSISVLDVMRYMAGKCCTRSGAMPGWPSCRPSYAAATSRH